MTFGKLTELTGTSSIELEAVRDTDALKAWLIARFPELGKMKYFLAVDNKMAQSNTTINADSKLAIMPPFSGG